MIQIKFWQTEINVLLGVESWVQNQNFIKNVTEKKLKEN